MLAVLDPIFSDSAYCSNAYKNTLWFHILLEYIFSEDIQERWMNGDMWEWINQVALGKETGFSLRDVSCTAEGGITGLS